MRFTITASLMTILCCSLAGAATHYVLQEYESIQAAIDASQDFDTVIVADGNGTYSGLGSPDWAWRTLVGDLVRPAKQ
ncbi:MAG: hypothetical protein ACYTBS_23520 [Planctomycetota bacterium]|jgi:hypothetical protein